MNCEKCLNCEYGTEYSGQYGGVLSAPACNHPKAGTRVVTPLSEMEKCPKE